MKRFHAHICSMQPALYERPEIFKRIGMYAATNVFNGMIHDFMFVIVVESDVSLECIRVECRASMNLFPNQRLQVILAALRNNLCPNFSAALHESNHDCLVVVYATSKVGFAVLVHVPRLASNKGFVNLDFAIL